MSFIDLMANDVWTEAAIKARLHAEIRSEVSADQEAEINRALQGAGLGVYQLTVADRQLIGRFKGVVDRVTALGVKARADAALLVQVLAVEAAQRRLAQPVVDTEADTAERAEAQAVVDAATPEALALLALRNPPPLEPAAQD